MIPKNREIKTLSRMLQENLTFAFKIPGQQASSLESHMEDFSSSYCNTPDNLFDGGFSRRQTHKRQEVS